MIAASQRVYLLAFPGGRQLHRKQSLHQPELSVRAVVLMAPIEWRLSDFSDFAYQLSPFHFPSQRQISLRFSETSHVSYIRKPEDHLNTFKSSVPVHRKHIASPLQRPTRDNH